MNTFDQNRLASSFVIHDLINDYNVQSMDFINRCPSWICECLADLNIQLQYVDKAARLEFDNYRCLLPDGVKSIRAVIVNNHRAIQVDNPAPIEANSLSYIPLAVSFPQGHLLIDNVVFDISQLHTDDIYQYSINSSYLHLNVSQGELGLLYKGLPFVLDEITKINVPLIPNHEVLKEAIKNYCMMRILQRGYIHPVLNLKENNEFTNPALAYKNAKIKVRNVCNNYTKDKADGCTRILLNFFNMKNHYVN